MSYRQSQIPPFPQIAARIADVARRVTAAKVDAFATSQTEAFKQRIWKQDFVAFETIPLSPEYYDWKFVTGLDTRTMIATKTYVRSITLFRTARPDGGVEFRIGFDPHALAKNEYGEPEPITLDEVARIQEFGSAAAHIPARPHWRPHLDRMRQLSVAVRRQIRNAIVRELRRELPELR